MKGHGHPVNDSGSDDPRYDHAVAAAALIVNLFDTSPGASKPELLSKVVFVILEAVKAIEAETRPHGIYRESVN